MPKINPYYIPTLPETATVSYFNESEWDKDLNVEEIEQREILYEMYRRDMALYGPQCGPGFEDWLKFGAKLTIGVAASAVLGPVPALLIGAGVGGGAKVISECTEDEDAKKVFGFIADCGSGVASGVIAGAGVIPSAIAGGTGLALHGIKQGVEDEDTKRALNFVAGCGTDAGIGGLSAGLIKSTRLISPNIDIGQRFAEAITGDMSIGGKIGTEVVSSSTTYFTYNAVHEGHKEEGISYDPNCLVCNS